MTDEKLILNFLDKNYDVKTDRQSFIFFDKSDEKTFKPRDFNSHFLKIFGDFNIDNDNTSTTILQSWFSLKKRILTKVLYDVFDSLDNAERSQKQLSEVLKICTEKYKYQYHEDFITSLFLEYYKDKFITPKLDKYIKGFNSDLGSKKLIGDFQDEFILEHHQLITYAKEYLNNWYSETVIGGKVNDLLSQLVITLGPRNWVVTWIGHGPLSRATLLKTFINESKFHNQFILDMYDKWYEEAVISASERVMRNPDPNWRLTNH
jgi:hypothetical protein